MIIEASQRSGARNLANHLANTKDNDHVTLHEIRGLAGNSLHAALLEIDAVSKGTRCQQPLFSVSFNPPIGENVTHAQFDAAFEKLEKKLGLENQPRVVVYHEKEGRRHCHVVWSRIDVQEMKAINMAHFKHKCTDISRELYLEHGWQMPPGFTQKQEKKPSLSYGERQALKRKGVDPKELKTLIQNAWKQSDNQASFKHALEERGLFLAKGDKRGFVLLDHTKQVFSLSRNSDIKTKDLKARLGSPDNLPSVATTQAKINVLYNGTILQSIKNLKQKHKGQMLPLKEQKAILVEIQRAERRERQDRERIKRRITAKSAKDRFRRGIMGFFDKVTGREKRIRLIGKKQLTKLKKLQSESRQKMIFRHNMERAELQSSIEELKQRQLDERTLLAKQIYDDRKIRDHQRQDNRLSREFEKSTFDQKQEHSHDTDNEHDQEQKQERQRKRSRKRSRRLE